VSSSGWGGAGAEQERELGAALGDSLGELGGLH
jgi:hypothetical protein